MTPDTNKERADFEAHYFAENGNRLYCESQWRGWQARAAKAHAAPTQAEFALRALVAAGFVTQAKVNEAMTLPGAPPAATGYQQALDIRTAHGWKLGGDKIPVLYTDEINGQQVCRDDVWLCTTAAFAVPPAAEPVAYSLQWPDDVAHNRINISTTFDTEKEAQEWLDKCGAQKNIRVVPLTIAAPPAPTEQWMPIETAPRDGTVIGVWGKAEPAIVRFVRWAHHLGSPAQPVCWVTATKNIAISNIPTHWIAAAPPQGAAKGAT